MAFLSTLVVMNILILISKHYSVLVKMYVARVTLSCCPVFEPGLQNSTSGQKIGYHET